MKLLLISDTQFSEQPNLSRPTATGIPSRLVDQVECFRWAVRVGLKHACDTFVVLGDIYDSRTAVPVSVLDQVGECFNEASQAFDRVIALVGNHDSAMRRPGVNSLRPLTGMASVISESMVIDELAFVPWYEDDEAFDLALGKVAASKTAKFLFAHVMVEGAVPADVGRSASLLRPSRWERIFLGDVHEPVKLPPNIQYVGAPMQHHFGDAGGRRGVWVFDGRRADFVENTNSPRFHVVRMSSDVAGIREQDYARIETVGEDARKLEAAVSKRTQWVENMSVVVDEDVAPRIAVSVSDPHRKVLQRYMEFRGVGDVSGLVDVGLELIEEAR